MKSKLKIFTLVVLLLGFAALTVALFIPNSPILPLFSLFLFIILAVQGLGKSPLAFMMTGFATLLGIFSISSVPETGMFAIPIYLLTLWGSSFLLHLHQEKIRGYDQFKRNLRDDQLKRNKIYKKEIEYYEARKKQLSAHAQSRRQLAQAARELGSLLEPQAILEKLIHTAQSIFPNQAVEVTYGQNPDPIDRYIIQKRQPVLVPGDLFKGDPLMAVPVSAQRSVAGILRVANKTGGAYTRDDLRILDILGSLASLALDNSLLFTQVEDSALRDGLTGLMTHKAFQDELENGTLEASRYNQPMSIILTDVDHFKSINDNYGHQAGDQVLQGFAHVLARNIRDVDVVARYGGEEFIILLLNTGHADALQVAEQIRQDLEAQRFESNGQIIQITGSFGVATFPDDSTSSQQLVRKADQRLYAAKQAGRNQVQGKAA